MEVDRDVFYWTSLVVSEMKHHYLSVVVPAGVTAIVITLRMSESNVVSTVFTFCCKLFKHLLSAMLYTAQTFNTY